MLTKLANETVFTIIEMLDRYEDARALWCVVFRANKESRQKFVNLLDILDKKYKTKNKDVACIIEMRKVIMPPTSEKSECENFLLLPEVTRMIGILRTLWDNLINFQMHVLQIDSIELSYISLKKQGQLRKQIITYNKALYEAKWLKDSTDNLLTRIKRTKIRYSYWPYRKPNFSIMSTMNNIDFLKQHLRHFVSYIEFIMQQLRMFRSKLVTDQMTDQMTEIQIIDSVDIEINLLFEDMANSIDYLYGEVVMSEFDYTQLMKQYSNEDQVFSDINFVSSIQ